MANITYEQAREMSVWRWKNFPTSQPTIDDWRAEFNINKFPKHNCGFCEIYLNNFYSCRQCPVYWDDRDIEKYSDYSHIAYPCSRNYWHWMYWFKVSDKKRMKYWAKKLLAEIEATPEYLEGDLK